MSENFDRRRILTTKGTHQRQALRRYAPEIAELRLELHTFRMEAEGNFRTLHKEIAAIECRPDLIEQNYANLKGVTKEIDEIRPSSRRLPPPWHFKH